MRSSPQSLERALLRATRWAIPIALAFGVMAGFLAARAPATYASSETLLLARPTQADASLGLLALPTDDPAAFRAALMDGSVARAAFIGLNGRPPSPDELLAFRRRIRVGVGPRGGSGSMSVSCRASDAAVADRCVRALSDALIAWDRARGVRALQRSITALGDEIARLTAVLDEGVRGGQPLSAADRRRLDDQRRARVEERNAARARLASAVPVSTLVPILGGDGPAQIVAPRPSRVGVIAATAGLVLVWVFASVAYLEERRRSDRSPLAAALGLPVLGELPVARGADGRVTADAIDPIASRIQHAARKADGLVMAVTSLDEPSARQGVSIALAASLARSGHRVLLVDIDLREGRLTRQLGIQRSAAVPLEEHLQRPKLDYTPMIVDLNARRSCDFVPSFGNAAHPSELLSRGLAARLQAWRRHYPFVVLDGPSVFPFADILSVAPLCSGVLVCADAARSAHAQRVALRPMLGADLPPLTGLILTHTQPARRAWPRRFEFREL